MSLFWQLAALIATLFIGKRRASGDPPDRIQNFQCVVETALSSCQFQTILLNPCKFFSLRPMSMLMEREFGPTELRIFNRTFAHTYDHIWSLSSFLIVYSFWSFPSFLRRPSPFADIVHSTGRCFSTGNSLVYIHNKIRKRWSHPPLWLAAVTCGSLIGLQENSKLMSTTTISRQQPSFLSNSIVALFLNHNHACSKRYEEELILIVLVIYYEFIRTI